MTFDLLALTFPSVGWVVPFLLGVLLAVVVAWGWSTLLNLIWATGVDHQKRLVFTVPPVRFVLFVAVWISAAWTPVASWSVTPMTRLVLFIFFTLLLTVWGLRHLRDMLSALTICVVQSFRLGDEIATDQIKGRLVSFGLVRSGLRTADGGVVIVRNTELTGAALRVSARHRGALPIEVVVELPTNAPLPQVAEALHDHVLLSVYTDASAPVIVELMDQGHARLAATPTHPDEADELRSDLRRRAKSIGGVTRRSAG